MQKSSCALPILLAFLLCSSFASHATLPPAREYACRSLLAPHRTTPPSADEIIKQACAEATATHKKVMVLFHASWCTWCHKLDTLMASPECKPLFDQYFVVCHLIISEAPEKRDQENPGAQELYDKYADRNSGIPFFLIMTPDGTVIADSRIKPAGAKPGSSGNNIGYPASKAEIDYYLRTLRETTSLTAAQLTIIREKLIHR
ncbi:MAG TPA: thioredoxin family protein [Puia sp.]|nr:thioredoxin family protein [Puia sp.]